MRTEKGQIRFRTDGSRQNGTIRLPQKAIEIFEITENDALLVVGDKTQGIAIVKCGGTNDFIDENSGKEIR